MTRSRIDVPLTLVVGAGAVVSALLMTGRSGGALQACLALAFLFYGVGYALSRALLVRNEDMALQLIVSVGLSLTAIIVVGIAAGLAGAPMEARVVVPTELGVVAIATVAATVRGGAGSSGELLRRLPSLRSPWALATACLCVVGVVAAGIWALARPLPNSTVAGYAALSAQWSGGFVDVRVLSAETRTTTFDIRIVRRSKVIATFRQVALRPGAGWRGRVVVPPRSNQPLTVQLLRPGGRAPVYRQVVLSR